MKTKLALFTLSMLLSAASLASEGRWNFRVFLDDREIGYHRFALEERGAERELKSEARFSVNFLFFNAYRYSHDALERWRGDCLEALVSRTDDNGESHAVDWKSASTGQGGCAMSFAYWNPRILKASRLLNAQTGELERVRVEALGEERIDVAGRALAAQRYRLTGREMRIDLWYSGGRWVALEADAEGGRRLRYRLEPRS